MAHTVPLDGVVCCTTGQALGYHLSRELGIPLVSAGVTPHPDGELSIRIRDRVAGRRLLLVGTSATPVHASLFEIALFADALVRAGVAGITAVVPYIAYARQDRVDQPGKPISLSVVGSLLHRDEIDHLYTVELHNPETASFFPTPLVNLPASDPTAAYLRRDVLPECEAPVLVSPDKGRGPWVKALGEQMGLPAFHMEKRRLSDREVEVTSPEPLEGRDVILLDDMIATGGSMARAVRMAREEGARSVHCAAVHGVFAEHAETRLFTEGAASVAVSNSLNTGFSRIDITPTIAEAILKDHEVRSPEA